MKLTLAAKLHSKQPRIQVSQSVREQPSRIVSLPTEVVDGSEGTVTQLVNILRGRREVTEDLSYSEIPILYLRMWGCGKLIRELKFP